MLNPRPSNYSNIKQCVRRSDTSVEIVRWYSGPCWGNRSRVYRPTAYSEKRLSIIAAGLRAGAH
jgi:hypothetical protein